MCTACKNVKFTLLISAGLLLWLSALYGVGEMLLH